MNERLFAPNVLSLQNAMRTTAAVMPLCKQTERAREIFLRSKGTHAFRQTCCTERKWLRFDESGNEWASERRREERDLFGPLGVKGHGLALLCFAFHIQIDLQQPTNLVGWINQFCHCWLSTCLTWWLRISHTAPNTPHCTSFHLFHSLSLCQSCPNKMNVYVCVCVRNQVDWFSLYMTCIAFKQIKSASKLKSFRFLSHDHHDDGESKVLLCYIIIIIIAYCLCARAW